MGNATSRKNATLQRHLQIRSKEPSLESTTSPPRFVADVMLGRLAKWLRIAGFDVLYSNRFADDELVRLSNGEGRILLSRDTRLLVRRAVNRFIFLESEDVRAQLKQVFRHAHVTRLVDDSLPSAGKYRVARSSSEGQSTAGPHGPRPWIRLKLTT
ncbi:MAG: hypothetical protein H6Q06_286 [Acidobacteria bacterium]|nr:hypothetical protein [Acidobacteriota bacterium]